MSTNLVLFILLCLIIKHFYIDFVNQSTQEVSHKGILGDPIGIWHSAKHGLVTIIILVCFIDSSIATLIGYLEFMVHYFTDWAKMRFGPKDMQTKVYWVVMGADQLVHYLTYLAIVWGIA